MIPNRLVLLGSVGLDGPAPELSRMQRATQQRRLALLAVIATASPPNARIGRDRVLGLLWPDRDERTARHLLADSLYVLRGALGARAIVTSNDTLRLAPELVWTDVAEFRTAVQEERWGDALELYRGDFLDGFHLRNANDFEQWALAERATLRTTALRAASLLANALEKSGRLAEAVTVTERRLELVSSDEAALRDLVRLLIASDNRGRAKVVARAFVERLAREVNVAPSAETMQVVRDLCALGVAEPIIVMGSRTKSRSRRRHTDSLTASLIAQGRHQWRRRTRSCVERAIEYFTRAAERDPKAVDAWCGLADSWTVMAGRGYMPRAEAAGHATASVERALALDDARSQVHASIAGVNIMRRRWSDVESALVRALQLDPHNADARHWLAMTLLTAYGDHAAALREQTITARVDPVCAIQIGALGWLRYLQGEFELSRSEMEPIVDLNADLEEAHAWLARAAARVGDEAGVTKAIEAGLTRRGDLRGDLLAEQASALAVMGDVRRATRLANEACAVGGMPLNLALAWASVGHADRAFECLAREEFRVYWAPQAVWWDPRFDVIRDDRRFARVHARVARVWSPEWV